MGCGLALVVSAASGNAAERSFTVEYTATKGCPTREVFVDEIRRRTAIARVAGPGEQPEVSMRVRIDRRGRRSKGRLDITIGTTASQRDLEDASCAEVTSALALIAALAIDPLAETSHLPPLPLPPDPHVPKDVGVRPAIPEPKYLGDPHYLGSTHAKVPRQAEVDLLVPRALPAYPYVPSEKREVRVRVGPGAHFTVDIGTGPVPLVGVAGSLGVRSIDDVLAWSLRAEVTYAVSSADATAGDVPGGDPASFRLLRGRLEGCLPGWRATDWFVLWPCADLGGGALWGEVSRNIGGTEVTRDGTSPWLAGGLSGRAELFPTEWLGFELRAGPDFPLLRGSFKDDRDNEIFTAAPITLSLGVGATLAF